MTKEEIKALLDDVEYSVKVEVFEDVIKPLAEQYIAQQEQLKEAMLMLDNVKYWDSCPDDYIERIDRLIEVSNG